MNHSTSESNSSLFVQLGAATAVRFVVHTGRRFAYPFAGALSRGLGRPLPAITFLLALSQATGVLSPIFGPLGDRWGYRTMMLLALGAFTGGMVAGAAVPTFAVFGVALFLVGLCKNVYDPALHAYVGESVPYARRGRAIGLVEFAWSGSTLVGIPVMGLLIERRGWQAPFWILGALGGLGMLALAFVLPRLESGGERRRVGFGAAWRTLRGEPAALAFLVYIFFFLMANDAIFVVYGPWLEENFGLGIAAIGGATVVIGGAELLGEMLTATLTDRLGVKRALGVGGVLAVLAYLALPFLSGSLTTALVALFLVFLTFEFTMVSSIALFSEVLPGARATMLSTGAAVVSLGRMVGTLAGGVVWAAGGIVATGAAGALLCGVSLAVLLWGMRRWRPS